MTALRGCWLTLLWALTACGGEPQAEPTTGVAAVHGSCVELATARCANFALCRSASFVSAYGDEPSCIQRQAKLCEGTLFGVGTTTTPAQVRACARATDLSSWSLDERCDKWLEREVFRKRPSECAFAGELEEGAACADAAQCAGGHCRPAPLCGTCRAPVTQGGECFEDRDCIPGSVCVNQLCVAPGGQGSPCETSAQCSSKLGCTSGTCQVRSSEGQPCTPGGDSCVLWPTELACNPATGTCEPLTISGYRDPCDAVAKCTSGFVCRPLQPTQSGVPGVCLAAVGDGLSCKLTGASPYGSPCQAPAVCADGFCQFPDSAACAEPPP